MTPVEQIEKLSGDNAALVASVADLTAKIAQLEADAKTHAEQTEIIEAARAEIAKHGEAVAALTKERDESRAEAQKARDAMALKPHAFDAISDGAKPVADGAAAAEKPIGQKLSELMAAGKHAEARELYKQHRAEFKRRGIVSPNQK